ncbi:MAG: AI-2E family transporter [Lachnospiraceae bacterium]|nr:AI-2E family transporter [Lachnospiraceae bacterium]
MFAKLYQIFLVLFVGILIACLFSVPVRNLNFIYGKKIAFLRHRKKWRNRLAVFSWYGSLLLILTVLFGLFYYNISGYFAKISWEDFIGQFVDTINNITDKFPVLNSNRFKIDTSAMVNILFRLPRILGKMVISVLISIYLLLDWDSYLADIRKWRRRVLSKKTNRFLIQATQESKEILFSYLKGQSMDALLMGILISLGLWFIHVPLGISIGILAGIGNLVPYLGPIIAFSLTIIVCIIEESYPLLVIALIYLILIQQLDSSIIGPKILGRQMQIRPLFIIVSILIGGTLFGVAGMIFAVPAAGILKSFLKKCYERII